ncbi:putative bifunctional diguanylate cyclase/phosphodiesterase [Nitrincola alkalilacustris]|uniref:putative bifunctional diguanylate cyclase/phosphodiesterase n=1 Tax=Nitrincola alkalilacustris TaxID=1571224 RepID=UPI00124EC339|nr:EAL domain-containing protein [Nitrincola alkalilacustris]
MQIGIRGKLVLLFVAIKVIPLLLLGWLAWTQAGNLGQQLATGVEQLLGTATRSVNEVGRVAIADAVEALDARARDDIERQTTDVAQAIATFLYERDSDLLLAATLPADPLVYEQFLSARARNLTRHGEWQLADDNSAWEPLEKNMPQSADVDWGSDDNARAFNYQPPYTFTQVRAPLYLEMTFIDLLGQEQIKITTSDRVSHQLRDISDPQNTYIKAERYFSELQQLEPGDIHVSDVIGAYVGTSVIGPYTPESAARAGVEFAPHESAYAGKENPLGRRFEGLVRWATPVVQEGEIIGWVTLALDHDHIMAFTDFIVPTPERYTDITDASSGNYAFIWDHKARSIAHPRHHSIVGYDPETGRPAPAWLEDAHYEAWQASGLAYEEYLQQVPEFSAQSITKKPSLDQMRAGQIGLDCRYLNFAPQCVGWHNLTQHGGSGSFMILWSGLWKLTTAAAIPYYTGQYGDTPRGFGFVTIGANVDEFHKPANESRERLDQIVMRADGQMAQLSHATQAAIDQNLGETARSLTISTMVMIVLVVLIAIWMASYMSGRISWLVTGISRFRRGDRSFRFRGVSRDELGDLAVSFNEMADAVGKNLLRLEEEVTQRRETEAELLAVKANLEDVVAERTRELTEANDRMKGEIVERRAAQEKAHYLAGHDALTGLANRFEFNERLLDAVRFATRKGRCCALLFFDLDKFKAVNDHYGHGVGDELLIAVAGMLREVVRDTDVVARLGGDEFAIILNDLKEPESAAVAAQKVIDMLSQPIQIADHLIQTGTSIGITTCPGDTQDPEELLLHADLAMYQAKEEGGSAYHFFIKTMHDEVKQRKLRESELKIALQEQQLTVHYQPRHYCHRRGVSGVEALVRWQHPTQGLLLPEAFLDIAGRCGLLAAIDEYVITTACHQAREWLDQGLECGRVAVNLSPSEIAHPNFVARILNVLASSGLPADRLELEITERAILANSDMAIANLVELRQMGIMIAIDDFGTEYSSLKRLIDCPIDVIKIDRYFVSHMDDVKSSAVIKAIIAMAKSINLEIVAEGIEGPMQIIKLQVMGCDVLQGFHIAKPMPAEMLPEHLRVNQLRLTTI